MKNKIVLATVLAMVAMFSIMGVSAAVISVTLNAPSNYTNHTGTFTYNCTTSAHAVKNVTVYANSSAGVMNALQVFTNTSAAQTAWTGTVTITSADDGANQNISCFAQNGTVASAYSAEIAATHVMLDSTDPVCSIDKEHAKIAYKGNQKMTWSSSDATELVSTVVTIDRPQAAADLSYTDANSVTTLTSQDTKYVGDWTASMVGTDRAGNTCTDSVTFKSYLPGDNDEAPTPTDDKGKTLLIVGVLALVLWLIFGKKK